MGVLHEAAATPGLKPRVLEVLTEPSNVHTVRVPRRLLGGASIYVATDEVAHRVRVFDVALAAVQRYPELFTRLET